MRLEKQQVQSIKRQAAKWAPGAETFVFGSRTDPAARGGDIDLLVLAETKLPLATLRRLRRAVLDEIGEQKLDSEGAINTSLSEVVRFDAPATEGFFVVRAPAGVRFLTGTNDTAGIALTPGGAWSTLSDSNAKTDITAVDHAAVLRQAAELPVTAWSYRPDPHRRHIGPMAQDFHVAFGLGSDDRHITMLDTDGVALSALKGLIAELQERKERHAAQARRLAELEAELLALSERLSGVQVSARAE
jgi:predicted nucleotidyltransferase